MLYFCMYLTKYKLTHFLQYSKGVQIALTIRNICLMPLKSL